MYVHVRNGDSMCDVPLWSKVEPLPAGGPNVTKRNVGGTSVRGSLVRGEEGGEGTGDEGKV